MPAAPQSSRTSVWEWAQVALLVGNLAWTTLCLGGFRPETMVVTSALNALLLAVHLLARAANPGAAPRLNPAGWWLLPFLAYAAANVLWVTPVPWLGWRDWLGWAQLLLVFWVVLNGVRSTAARTALFGGLAAVAFVTVVLACYQRFVHPDWLMLGRIQADQFIGRASGSFGIPNSLAALLLLLIPPMAALALRRASGVTVRLLGAYLALAFTFGLVLTISRGAVLALALVLVAWPLFGGQGSRRRRWGLAALAALAVAAAFAVLYFSLPKVRERFAQMKVDAGERTRPIMWRGAWQIFRAHPAWGGGGGSYNHLFEPYRPARYQDEPLWAHNDYLNTLSDYGAVGFLLFFGVGGGIAWRLARSRTVQPRDWLDDPGVAGALVAGLAAFGLQLLLDFHFKIPALAMAFAIVAALVVQRGWPPPFGHASPHPVARGLGLAVALGGLLAAVCCVGPFYRGEALRYSARQAVNRLATTRPTPEEVRHTLELARADLGRALELAPRNGQAWSDLAYVLSLEARTAPTHLIEQGREAESASAQALAISGVVPEFWIRHGVALDMQGRRTQAGPDFAHALSLAPASASVWFYYAYHLSLNSADPGLALAAVEFSLRLDPGNAEAQSLRQRLAFSRSPP